MLISENNAEPSLAGLGNNFLSPFAIYVLFGPFHSMESFHNFEKTEPGKMADLSPCTFKQVGIFLRPHSGICKPSRAQIASTHFDSIHSTHFAPWPWPNKSQL